MRQMTFNILEASDFRSLIQGKQVTLTAASGEDIVLMAGDDMVGDDTIATHLRATRRKPTTKSKSKGSMRNANEDVKPAKPARSGRRKYRSHSENFKRDAVALVNSGEPVAQVAKKFGIHRTQINNWRKKLKKSA